MRFQDGGPKIDNDYRPGGTSATVGLGVPELGAGSFYVSDAGTAAKNTIGATKCLADNTAATSGYEGRQVTQPAAATAALAGFVGLLMEATGYVASGVAGAAEFGHIQCYGYFEDACLDTAVVEGANLVAEDATNDLITVAGAWAATIRTVAVALQDDAAGLGDVFLFAL